MKHIILSIYDCKAEAYDSPVFVQSRGVAIRELTEAVNNPQHRLSKHSSDLTVFEVGTFDFQTGTFELHDAKIALCTLSELKKVDNVTSLN